MSADATEQQLREQIVEIGRRMWEREYVAANDGNVSVRLPDGNVLCTPTFVSKGTMTPESLPIVTLEGEVVSQGDGPGPSSEILMHLRCYIEDPSVVAVVHAHPATATAFAIRGEGLHGALMPEVVVVLGDVPLAPFAVPSTQEMPDSVAPFVKGNRACLLEHHGALSWSSVSLEDAYLTMERVEHVAKITAIARGLGGEREIAPADMERMRARFGL